VQEYLPFRENLILQTTSPVASYFKCDTLKNLNSKRNKCGMYLGHQEILHKQWILKKNFVSTDIVIYKNS